MSILNGAELTKSEMRRIWGTCAARYGAGPRAQARAHTTYRAYLEYLRQSQKRRIELRLGAAHYPLSMIVTLQLGRMYVEHS